MKLCVFKKDGTTEVITPKAYKRTLDSIESSDDLLRFIHKKTSKGVYPKNHTLKGPYFLNGSKYYVTIYSLKDMPKKYKSTDVWNIYPFNETINVVDVVVVFKYLVDSDEDKMLPANISNDITIDEVTQLVVKTIDLIEKDDSDSSDDEENEGEEEDDDDEQDEDEEQSEIICKKKKKKRISKEINAETKNDNNLTIPDDLDIIVATDGMLQYESYDYDALFVPENVYK